MATVLPARLPRSDFRSGALEAAKWAALLAMVVDHVDAVFFGRSLGLIPEFIGRLAMPLFTLVLAYNLARPGVDLGRVQHKLLWVGLLSAYPYWLVFGHQSWLFAGNVLLTFWLGVEVVRQLDKGRSALGWAVLAVGGFFVDYGWVGSGLLVAAVLRFRQPSPWNLAGYLVALVALCFWNGNPWVLAAVPALHWFNGADWLQIPRVRNLFWIFYPAHLVVLALLAALAG